MARKGITPIISTIIFIAISIAVAGSTLYFVKDVQDTQRIKIETRLDTTLEDMSIVSASDIRRCQEAQDEVVFLDRITGLAGGSVVLVGNHPEILVDYEDASGNSFMTVLQGKIDNDLLDFTAYGPLSSSIFRMMLYSEILDVVTDDSFVFMSADPDNTYLIVDDGVSDPVVYEYVTKTCGVHSYVIGERVPSDPDMVLAMYPSLVDGQGEDWWLESIIETLMFESEDALLADIRARIDSAESSVVLIGNTPVSIADDETISAMLDALDRGVSVEAIGPVTAEVIAMVGPTKIAELLWNGFVGEDTDGNVTDPEPAGCMVDPLVNCHEVAYVVVDGSSYKYMTGSPVYTQVVPDVNPIISASLSDFFGTYNDDFKGEEIVVPDDGIIGKEVKNTDGTVLVSVGDTFPDTTCKGGVDCGFVSVSLTVVDESDLGTKLEDADVSSATYDSGTYDDLVAEIELGRGSVTDYLDRSSKVGNVRDLKEDIEKTVADSLDDADTSNDVEEVVFVVKSSKAMEYLTRDFMQALADISESVKVTVVLVCSTEQECREYVSSFIAKTNVEVDKLENLEIKQYVDDTFSDDANVFYKTTAGVVRDKVVLGGTVTEDNVNADSECTTVSNGADEVDDNNIMYTSDDSVAISDAIDANRMLAYGIYTSIFLDGEVIDEIEDKTGYILKINLKDKLILSSYHCSVESTPDCITQGDESCYGVDELYKVIKDSLDDYVLEIDVKFLSSTTDSDVDARYGCMCDITINKYCPVAPDLCFSITPDTSITRNEFVLEDSVGDVKIAGYLDDDGKLVMSKTWDDNKLLELISGDYIEYVEYLGTAYISVTFSSADANFDVIIDSITDKVDTTDHTGYLNGDVTGSEGYFVVKFNDKYDIDFIDLTLYGIDNDGGLYRLDNAEIQYSFENDCSTWVKHGDVALNLGSYSWFDPFGGTSVKCLRYFGEYHTSMGVNPSFKIVELNVTGTKSFVP